MYRMLCILSVCFLIFPETAVSEDRYFDAAGVRIRYVESGKGEPIVLLHGGTSNLESWAVRGVLPNLEKDFRVIAFDARGHGKSDKPRDPSAYGRQQALDIVRLLDTLRIDRAHIIGYSLGGSTVAQLLTMHPERFLTAVQISGAGRSPALAKDTQQNELEASEIEKNCISRSRITRQAPAHAKPSEVELQKREAACRANKDFDQYATAASIRGYRDQIITPEQVKAIKVPTLGVVGSLDSALQPMQDLAKMRPEMKFVIVEGASHTGPDGIQGRPELITAIREFIASQPQAKRGTSN